MDYLTIITFGGALFWGIWLTAIFFEHCMNKKQTLPVANYVWMAFCWTYIAMWVLLKYNFFSR